MAYTHHEDTAHEIHGEYRWRHFDGTSIHDGTALEAASAMHLDVHEVEWAVEEYGRCDTAYPDEEGVECIVCWKPGTIEMGGTDPEHAEPIGGGYEWPAAEAPTQEDPPSPKRDFIDSLILLIDDAEQEDLPYSVIIENLEQAIADVKERAAERKAKDERR
jgi:hypothetical protein